MNIKRAYRAINAAGQAHGSKASYLNCSLLTKVNNMARIRRKMIGKKKIQNEG